MSESVLGYFSILFRVAKTGVIGDYDDEGVGSVPGGEAGIGFGFYGAETRVDEGDYGGNFVPDEVWCYDISLCLSEDEGNWGWEVPLA